MNKKQALALILAVSMTVPTFTNTSLAVKENFNEVKNVLSDEVKKEDKQFFIGFDIPEQKNLKVGDILKVNIEFRNTPSVEFGNIKFYFDNWKLEFVDDEQVDGFGNSYILENENNKPEEQWNMLNYWMKQKKVNKPVAVNGDFTALTMDFKIKELSDNYEELFYFKDLDLNTAIVNMDGERVSPKFKNQLDRVYIEYLDNFGTTISDKTYVKGFEGEDYKLEDKEIEGYTLEKVEGDKEGVFPDGSKTVKYIYKDNNFNIEDDWSTEDFNFEGTVLKGFSPRGLEKFKLGKTELIIPEKNADGEVITEIGKKAFGSYYLNKEIKKIYKDAKEQNITGKLVIPSTIKEIGSEAFSESQLTDLILNDSLEKIGGSAFEECSISGTFKMPKNLKEVDYDAFSGNNFESIIFNDVITEISSGVFTGNQIIGTLEIPKNIKKIELSAFSDNKIEKVIFNNGLNFIGSFAFKNNNIGGELIIPDSIETMDISVFESNNIESVKLGSGIKSISTKVFADNNINRIEFNKNLEEIENSAFENNKLSGELIISNSIKKISKNAFNSNPSAENPEKLVLKFKDGKNINHIPDGENFIVEGEKPVVAGGDITVKYLDEDGKEIKDSKVLKGNRFEKTKIEPEEIEGYKLLDNKVKEVEFTDKAQEIVFEYDKLIKDYKVEDFVFEGTVLKGFSEKGLEKFKNGSTELTIPEKNADGEVITEIGMDAFNNNTIMKNIPENEKKKLTGKLIIPKNIKKINTRALMNNKLTELVLNEGLEEIGSMAFKSNKISDEFIMPSTLRTIGKFAFNDNSIKKIKINNIIETIEQSSFNKNEIEGTIKIPKNVKTIEITAFSSNEIENLDIEEGLEKVDQKAFENNKLSGEIIIPKSIKGISKNAFNSNPSAEKPEKVVLKFKDGKNINHIPDGENFIVEGEKPVVAGGDITVKYLDKEGKEISESTVFSGNIGDSKKVEPKEIEGYKLVEGETKEYKFTDKAQEIVFKYEKEASKEFTADDFTFTGNILTGLSTEGEEKLNRGEVEFKLPTENKDGEKITEIGEKAFYGKDIKGELIIPETVKVIGVEAFYNNKIESVKLNEGLESIEDSAFNSNKIAGKLNLPKTLKNISKAAFSSNEITEIDLGENLNEIGREAFKNNMITGKLIIPSNITKLGAYAFSGNIINGVDIQANIEKIEREVFANNQIENVKISNSVKIIEKNAFYNNKINSLNLNEGLKQIKENAFDKNNLSGEIAIPSSVEKINKTAFNNNGSEKIILNLQDKENKNNLVDGNNFTIKKPEVVRGEDIIVKYLDEEGKEISESTVLSGNIGETEKIEPKKIDGYKLAEGEAKEYKFTDKAQEVVFKYEKEKSEVVKGEDITIKYLDEEGKEISESTVLNGNIGETEKIEPKDIDGYKLVEGEAKEYKFTDKAQEIVFKYEKKKSSGSTNTDDTNGTVNNFEVNRIKGSNRYSTAVEVSKAMYEKTDTVILVNGYKEADALTSSVLSDVYNAPILLTEKDNIPSETLKEIKRLGAKNILIIGGEGSISENLKSSLKGFNIERISGKNRYETSEKVAERIVEKTGKVNKFTIVRGDIFPDALAVSGLGIKEIAPIILTDRNKLSENNLNLLKENKADKVFIVGGNNSISENIEKEINKFSKADRISGKNRYETSIEIAKKLSDSIENIIIASGENGIDAMVAGPLTRKKKASIILSQKSNISDSLKAYLEKEGKNIKGISIIGGENTISSNIEKELK